MGVEEAAGHFLDWDVLTDALDINADAADVAGNGDEGKVIALGDGDSQTGGGAADDGGVGGTGFGVGVTLEDVFAEEGGLEFVRAVAGDGAGGMAAGGVWDGIEACPPDVEFVYGEAGVFGRGEPEGLGEALKRFKWEQNGHFNEEGRDE